MPPDPHAELIATAASVIAGMIVAHQQGDTEVVAIELGRLLQAVARYATPGRPDDAALVRAITKLGNADAR